MRPFYFLGYTLGTAANLLARPLVAHARLRCVVADLRLENAVLEAECAALAAIADDLARQLAAKTLGQQDLAPHLAAIDEAVNDVLRLSGPITSDEYADAMAVLDTDLTAQDLTWIWGSND